jgi:hypothetical protein
VLQSSRPSFISPSPDPPLISPSLLSSLLSQVISSVEPVLRNAAALGAWQVISPTPATGVVEVVEGLHLVQEKVYKVPTVLLAHQVRHTWEKRGIAGGGRRVRNMKGRGRGRKPPQLARSLVLMAHVCVPASLSVFLFHSLR